MPFFCKRWIRFFHTVLEAYKNNGIISGPKCESCRQSIVDSEQLYTIFERVAVNIKLHSYFDITYSATQHSRFDNFN